MRSEQQAKSSSKDSQGPGWVCGWLAFLVLSLLPEVDRAACLTYRTQFLLPALYRYASRAPPEPETVSPVTWPNTIPSPFYGIFSGEVYWNDAGATKRQTLMTFFFQSGAWSDYGLKLVLIGQSATSFALAATDLSGTVTQPLHYFTVQEPFFFRIGLNYQTAGNPSIQILKPSSSPSLFLPVVYVTDATILSKYRPPSADPSTFKVVVGGSPAGGDYLGSLYNFQLNYETAESTETVASITYLRPAYTTTSSVTDFDRAYSNPDHFFKVQRFDTVGYSQKHIVFQEPYESGLSVFAKSARNGFSPDSIADEADNGVSLSRFGFAYNFDSRIPNQFRDAGALQFVQATRIKMIFASSIKSELSDGCAAYNALGQNLRTHVLYGFRFKLPYYSTGTFNAESWLLQMETNNCLQNAGDFSLQAKFSIRQAASLTTLAETTSFISINKGPGQVNLTAAFEFSRGFVDQTFRVKARVYADSLQGGARIVADLAFVIPAPNVPGQGFMLTDFFGHSADQLPELQYVPLFRLVYQLTLYGTGKLLIPTETCTALTAKLSIGSSFLSPSSGSWKNIVCPDPTHLPMEEGCMMLDIGGGCKLKDGSTCKFCDHGYYMTSPGSCSPCPSGCQTCTASGCRRCSKGYFKTASGCTQYSTVESSTNLYYPAGQSLIEPIQNNWAPGSNALPSCSGGTYYCDKRTYTLDGTKLYTLAIYAELKSSATIDFKTFGSIILLVNNVPVVYNTLNFLGDVAVLSYLGTNLVATTFEIEIRALGALSLEKCRVDFKEHDYSVPCFYPGNHRCIACNFKNFYMAADGTCQALSPNQGVGFGTGYQSLAEYVMTCSAHIARCFPNNKDKAFVCDSGYYLTGSNDCAACDSPCSTCGLNSQDCTNCQAGYHLNPANVAPKCLIDCSPGFYADTSSNTCFPCLAPCASCTGPSTCTSCLPTYTMTDSACQIQCSSGFYRDSSLNICTPCISPCATCNSAASCQSCLPGFTLAPSTSKCIIIAANMSVEVKVSLSWNKLTKVLSLVFSKALSPDLFTYEKAVFQYNNQVLSLDETFRKSSKQTMTIDLKAELLLSKKEVVGEPVSFRILSTITFSDGGKVDTSAPSRMLEEAKYKIPAQEVVLTDGISYYQDASSERAAQVSTKVVTTTAVGVTSVIAMVQGGGSLASLIKMTQYTEALLLTSTYFPANFRKFIAQFSGYFMDLLRNPLEEYGYKNCGLPDSFHAEGFGCLYIQNNSVSLAVLCLFLLFKLIILTAVFIADKLKKQVPMFTKMNNTVNTNFFLGLVDTAVFDLVLPSLVNLSSSVERDTYTVINVLLSCLSLLFTVCFIGCTFLVSKQTSIQKTKQQSSGTGDNHEMLEESKTLKSRTSSFKVDQNTLEKTEWEGTGKIQNPTEHLSWVTAKLVLLDVKFTSEGFKSGHFYGNYKILIVQVITVLNALNLAFLSDFPLVQLILLSAPQFAVAIMTLATAPYESRLSNIKEGIVELLLAVASMVSIILITNPTLFTLSEYAREAKVGVTLIAIVGTIYALMFIFSIYEGYPVLKECALSICKPSRVTPSLKIKSPYTIQRFNRLDSPQSEQTPQLPGSNISSKVFWPSSKALLPSPKSSATQTVKNPKDKRSTVTTKTWKLTIKKPSQIVGKQQQDSLTRTD